MLEQVMAANPKSNKIIVIDANVISHFIEAGEILYIGKIFPYPIKILPQVLKELDRFEKRKKEVDNIINLRIIDPISFPNENHQIQKEYLYIKNKMFKGDGESACLAYARFSNNIIASSNLKDIDNYCKMHNVVYLATFDFLCQALRIGLFDVQRCDAFIKANLSKNPPAIFPATSMSQYTCRNLSDLLDSILIASIFFLLLFSSGCLRSLASAC